MQKLKNKQHFYFFLFSKLSFKPRERESCIGHAQWDVVRWVSQFQASFLGCHLHIKTFLELELLRMFFPTYSSCLLISLPCMKKSPLPHGVLLICPDMKAVIPELCLYSFISRKLKSRCQSSLKGSLTHFLPPFPHPSVDEDHQAKCGSQLLFGDIKMASALADRGEINHLLQSPNNLLTKAYRRVVM